MAVPKFFMFMRPFLDLLKDGEMLTMKDIRKNIRNVFNLSDEDVNELLPSGRQTVFANRVGWAGTYLNKAGLVEKPAKATFRITDLGKDVLQHGPAIIKPDYLLRFDSYRAFCASGSDGMTETRTSPSEETNETPDDVFESAYQQIRKELQEDLLAEVMKLSPTAFERMVLDLMAKMGYGTFENASQTTSRSGDEGIDGIIMEDKLGFSLIYVQAKKWGEDHIVGRPEVMEFGGALAGRDGRGLFVTTSRFSKQAIEYAARQHIVLMDCDKLTSSMIDHNFGVTVKKAFEIKAVDTDVFNDYSEE